MNEFTVYELFGKEAVLIVYGRPAKKCAECGALVLDATLHTTWHNKLLP